MRNSRPGKRSAHHFPVAIPRMNFAGTPPTTVFAGTSLVTTTPAAMTALLSMVTPCKIVEFEPTHTFLHNTIGAGYVFLRSSGSKPWLSVANTTIMPYLASVADGYTSVVLKMAASVNENTFTYQDIPFEIGIERREYPQRLRHLVTEQSRKQRTHFFLGVICRIQLKSNLTDRIAHLVHETVYLLRTESLARLYIFSKFCNGHTNSLCDILLG